MTRHAASLLLVGPLVGWTVMALCGAVFVAIGRVLTRADQHNRTLTDSETERHPS